MDLAANTIIFETLKKRRKGVYRAVPVPPAVIDAQNLAHAIREAQVGKDGGTGQLLWPFSRTSAWRYVQQVLNRAGLKGPQARIVTLMKNGPNLLLSHEAKPLKMNISTIGELPQFRCESD